MMSGFSLKILLLHALFMVSATSAALAQVTRSPITRSAELRAALPHDPALVSGVLPNGLRYYIRANDTPRKRAELRLVINTGSVLEDDDQRGLAHMVEHMAFRGTEDFGDLSLTRSLESIGIRFGPDINASTNFDETIFMLTVPTDSAGLLETGFRILENWAHKISFDSAQVERERPVVIEEWRLRQGAGARMKEKQLPFLFSGSRYASRQPIGERRILETFDHATLRRFYTDWYRPDLMAVVAVGDFDAATVENLVTTYFSGIRPSPAPRQRVAYDVPPNVSPQLSVVSDVEATGTAISIYHRTATRQRRTVADFRRLLVDELFTSMLNERLFELTLRPASPFVAASSGTTQLGRAVAAFTLSAQVADTGVEQGLEALIAEIRRIRKFGFTTPELDTARRKLLRAFDHSDAERNRSFSARYANQYVSDFLIGEPATSDHDDFLLASRLLPAISLTDVGRVAEDWALAKPTVLVSSPQGSTLNAGAIVRIRDILAGSGNQRLTPYVTSRSDEALSPARPVPGSIIAESSIGELNVTRWTLSNGIRVILKPTDFKSDQILFTAYSPGGSSLLPDEEYYGARGATLAVELSGVGRLGAVELQKALAGKLASVQPYVGAFQEGMSGSGSPRDLRTVFELIYLYFTAPRLDTTAFNAYRTRAKVSLAHRAASPEVAFADTLTATLTQNSYRSRPLTSDLIDSLDLRKSFAFYKERFADAGDFTFVFVGGFHPDSIRPLVETWLGGLPSQGRRESWNTVSERVPDGVVERVVRRGTEPKSHTRIVFTGPFEFTRQNRYALGSLADVLAIKLRETLREELGGTYGVSVSASTASVPDSSYTFSIDFGAAPERLEALTHAVFAQIDTLARFGIAPSYVANVRASHRRSRETILRQNETWLQLLALYDQAGWDPRQIQEFDSLVEGLSTESLSEAARLYLRLDSYVRVSLYPEAHPAVTVQER